MNKSVSQTITNDEGRCEIRCKAASRRCEAAPRSGDKTRRGGGQALRSDGSAASAAAAAAQLQRHWQRSTFEVS